MPKKKEKQEKKFECISKQFSITLPRCETTKERCKEVILHLMPEVRRFIIAQETHSGKHGPANMHHLHLFLEFSRKTEFPAASFNAAMGVEGSDIQATKKAAEWIGYIIKEDHDPLTNIEDWKHAIWKYPGGKEKIFYSFLEAGWEPSFLVSEYKDYIHGSNFNEWIRRYTLIKEAEVKNLTAKKKGIKKITGRIIDRALTKDEKLKFYSFEGYSRLVKHINEIQKYGFYMPHADHMNLLITGDTGIGKSTLLQHLTDYIPTYIYPLDSWHPMYDDNLYSLISWDEPKFLENKMSFYLLFLNGRHLELPVKGTHVIRDNHQKIIMTSNKTIDELLHKGGIIARDSRGEYHYDDQANAFLRRIEILNFKNLDLLFFIKLIIPEDKELALKKKKADKLLLKMIRENEQNKRIRLEYSEK